MSLTFQIIGARKLESKIRKIDSKMKRTEDLNHKGVILADRWVQKNLQKQGSLAHEGGKWQRLKEATIKARRRGRKKSKSVKILENIGTLRGSWKKYWNRRVGILENYATSEKGSYYYGLAHHEGRGHLPERRIMPSKKQFMPELLKLAGKWVKTNLK